MVAVAQAITINECNDWGLSLFAQRGVKHALADSAHPRSTCVLRRRLSPIVRCWCAPARRQLVRADRVHPGVRVARVVAHAVNEEFRHEVVVNCVLHFLLTNCAKETTIGRCMREPVRTARSLSDDTRAVAIGTSSSRTHTPSNRKPHQSPHVQSLYLSSLVASSRPLSSLLSPLPSPLSRLTSHLSSSRLSLLPRSSLPRSFFPHAWLF